MAARKQQDWAPAFLKALADTHLVTEACNAARIHRSTAYNRRAHDAEFARAWAEIEEASTEQLERIAVRRASEGSDVLLIFLLKARRPEVYRDHHRVEHTAPGGGLDVEFRLDAASREAIDLSVGERAHWGLHAFATAANAAETICGRRSHA